MLDFRIRSDLALAAFLISASTGLADTRHELSRAIEVFGAQCAQAVDAPEDFYRSALAEGDESPFMITQSDDEQVHWTLKMTQRDILHLHIGLVDGQTLLSCQYTLFAENPSQANTDRSNGAFVGAMSELAEAKMTGGAMAASGILSEQSGNPHNNYEYVIVGWPDIEQVVSASVQEGWFRLGVTKVLPRTLSLD